MFRAMKHVFIVNPAAGKSDRTESYRKLIDAAFVPRGLQYELLVSQAPGDCRKLAQQAAASGEESASTPAAATARSTRSSTA